MSTTIGHVKECHDPHNELCPNNTDIRFNCDCRSKVARRRTPYRVVRVKDDSVNHGHNPNLVCQLHPNGLLVIRERGRRRGYSALIGKVYNNAVWREAMVEAAAKKKRKRRS